MKEYSIVKTTLYGDYDTYMVDANLLLTGLDYEMEIVGQGDFAYETGVYILKAKSIICDKSKYYNFNNIKKFEVRDDHFLTLSINGGQFKLGFSKDEIKNKIKTYDFDNDEDAILFMNMQ